MSDPFIGEIRMFGASFAPQSWAFCGGQLMAISQNDALFALIGTTYGGDGQNTFALPNLYGRIPIHQGPGFTIGQIGGTESVTITSSQLPPHSHAVSVASNANTTSPTNDLVASTPTGFEMYVPAAGVSIVPAAAQSIPASGGGNQPHENMMPFLAVNFIICLFGIFPSQN